MGAFVAVDTGGTFTDLVTFDDQKGMAYTKSLTTHSKPIDGILDCVAKAGLDLSSAEIFKHGTTLVINTLLERSGPKVALVTTAGFKDVTEFGRGGRMEVFNLFYATPEPLVPRELRFEVTERIGGDGGILSSPNRSEVEQLAREIRAADVSAVAVSLINSYRQPLHERLVAGWLRELLPDHYITAGAYLTREWYEFERTSTAIANAYTGPKVGRHVEGLTTALQSRGFDGRLLLMGSSGGMLSPRTAAEAPVLLVESGPVGGCIGAGAMGVALGFDKIIAFDMGGTTAKCALVRDGHFEIESIYHVGGYGRGTPIRAPVLDIVEVGAGGGSLAWVDDQGNLKVGPRSAGSFPGPAAYGRGGSEPTVTDANLMIGRLNPDNFQGGEMKLDLAAMKQSLLDLGARLSFTGDNGARRLACGILEIAAITMSEAIKRITVQRGQDPRDYVLFAYGGGGPLHSPDLAYELDIPLVVIPPEPGNFSALGMLLADLRQDDSRTFLHVINEQSFKAALEALDTMRDDVHGSIREDFGDVEVTFDHSAEIRFVGQYHSVRVPVATERVAALDASFREVYRKRFGHAVEKGEAEFVSLHVTGHAVTPKPSLAELAGALPEESPQNVGERPVFFPRAGVLASAAIFQRCSLPIGFRGRGPSVIEEYGSTTVIDPADSFEIGPLGEIRITIAARGK